MKNNKQLNAYNTGLLQGKAYAVLYEKLEVPLSKYNISIPEWKLLGQVFESERIKLSDLADILRYDPPMVTKLVKNLEKKGLLKRTPDPNDVRAKIVTPTANGKKLILKIEPFAKNAIANVLKGVTRTELETYLKVLNKMVQNSKR